MTDKDRDTYSGYDSSNNPCGSDGYEKRIVDIECEFVTLVSDGFNENLMDYDFVKFGDTSRKNENLAKKASRKKMKNKKKYRSYRKRQHDKKGKVKNNKRSRRQREFSYIIKGDMSS